MVKKAIIILVTYVVILTIFIYIDRKKRDKMKNNYRITVAQLCNISVHSHGGNVYTLKFNYLWNEFEAGFDFALSDTTYNDRKRFFIQFDPKNPSVSEVITEFSVPDSLTLIPKAGWDTFPIPVRNKYEKYLLKKLYNIDKIHYQPQK